MTRAFALLFAALTLLAGAGQAQALARRMQREVDVARHLDRHVELEAGAADIAHARGADAGEPDVDVGRVRELEPVGAELFRGAGRPGAGRRPPPAPAPAGSSRGCLRSSPRRRHIRTRWSFPRAA